MMVNHSPLTPLSFLQRSVSVFAHKEAVIDRQQRWTYAQFSAQIQQLATALEQWGLKSGDRVAFLCPNTSPMLTAHFAIPCVGGVLVAINTRLSGQDIVCILNNCGARLLFADSEFFPLITSIREQLTTIESIITIIDHQAETPRDKLDELDYDEFLAQGTENPCLFTLDNENNPISINYTSGTSGQPKGVIYTHRGAYLNALGEALAVKMDSNTRYLWTLPMFHCNGWCFTWAVIAVGGTHVCLRKFYPKTAISLLKTEEITHFCGSPTILILLANDPTLQTLSLTQSLNVTTAGAPPSPTIIETMETLGMKINHVYGLTETYGPHSICEWQNQWDELPMSDRAKLKARQGVPYIHAAEMRVVDEAMQDIPPDGETMGEVVMRGNNVMLGYFNDPEATEMAFRGGWFHSGDLAVMYEDGYIELRDRTKDIIISRGMNISTIEIEQVIYQHPSVLEVAVIAIPDEKRGEVPKAFITLKDQHKVTEKEMIQFCRQYLAEFKCPKVVEFCQLPKTSTGKIQKYLLREQEWIGYDKRIY